MTTVQGKAGIEAKVIEDSVSSHDGTRITTFQLVYPRMIHQEFLTHRVFSRNAASSRAIPVKKMLKQVWSNPAMPIKFQKNKRGMQSSEDLDSTENFMAKLTWKTAAKSASAFAWIFNLIGVHKQFTNRLLDSFQYSHVVVTSTEWENFYWLRDHEDAQPEIRELARCMKEAHEKSNPNVLQTGEWHLPYVTNEELSGFKEKDIETLKKISTARCARVSYKNHDQSEPNISKDLNLYNMLIVDEPPHASPSEHQATPMDDPFIKIDADYTHNPLNDLKEKNISHVDNDGHCWSRNFKSWIQHRALLGV